MGGPYIWRFREHFTKLSIHLRIREHLLKGAVAAGKSTYAPIQRGSAYAAGYAHFFFTILLEEREREVWM